MDRRGAVLLDLREAFFLDRGDNDLDAFARAASRTSKGNFPLPAIRPMRCCDGVDMEKQLSVVGSQLSVVSRAYLINRRQWVCVRARLQGMPKSGPNARRLYSLLKNSA